MILQQFLTNPLKYLHQDNNKLTYVSNKLQTEAFHSQLKLSHSINIHVYTIGDKFCVPHLLRKICYTSSQHLITLHNVGNTHVYKVSKN